MVSVSLKNVSVEFPIYELNARSLKKQLIRLGTGGKLQTNDNKVITVKALDNISFSLEKGDRVGLVGHNGAGKSTLLRVLAKIYEPTAGSVHIRGRVAALLDVMLGMDPESTGDENILLSGIIRGLSSKEIAAKKAAIAEFAGLGDYLSVPVRTYSTGMRLRLAFSIATSIQSEVLVLDEIVGTGDAAFMQKAQQRFDDLIKRSEIVLLASHSNDMLRKFCNKILWLKAGQIAYFGAVEEGLALYGAATNK